MKQYIVHVRASAVVIGLALALVLARAAFAEGIGPADKWAWGANLGWLNFAPAMGGNDPTYATAVYSDHLEGYAWSENTGWIRLGTHTGGGAYTYGNTSNTDYGVNRAGDGRLLGFAWSSAVGWIRFDPPGGGVTIDATTGELSGYAWAENAGWISLRGTAGDATGYGVTTACASANALQALSLARTGTNEADVTLTWADDPANTGGYQVYRGTSPYFNADASTLIASPPAGSTSYVDVGVGNSTDNLTYVVRGVGSCGAASADSPRVGVFHFALEPGS